MNPKRQLRVVQAAVLALAAVFYFGGKALAPVSSMALQSHAESRDAGSYTVIRVVDGDTLKLSNGEKVRLIGVDTPEVHASNKLARDVARSKIDASLITGMGKKASDFTKSLVLGKNVRIEYDVKKRDRYDRILAYIYLDDGTFVNAKLIENGYAQVMTVPPNVKYSDLFIKLERQARQAGKGLWSDQGFASLK
jgi:micrococcal nuclease